MAALRSFGIVQSQQCSISSSENANSPTPGRKIETMATASFTTSRAQGTTLSQRLDGLRAALAQRIATYRLYRETLEELSHLSDRDLSDLGLSGADLRALAWETALKG